MNRVAKKLLAGALTLAALAAAEAPPGPAVELPPMIVEEAATLPPWLYVRADGTEYLSRCKETTTRGYVEMRRSRMLWVRALIPADLLARSDVPGVTVLVSQRLKPSNNSEVIGEVMQLQGGARPDGGYRRATTAPNMMLSDSDAVGVFAYIDESNFERRNLTISSDFVRYLLARRTPAPPRWLIDGIMAAYNAVLFEETPITLGRLSWHSVEELRALAKDSGAPRTLLPMGELFAGTGGAARHPKIAQMQAALLVRWALDPRNAQRDAFWKFAAQACAAPASEAMLREVLGFGFADLRDRLSDYLPTALREPLHLPLERSAALPALEIRRATPNEIARLRGEWERLAVPLVRRRHPDHAARYLEQARRTLRRAYDSGDRDPRLLASLGLCEIDAGELPAARDFLDAAVVAGVVRPRAAYELARLRWGDLVRGQPATRHFAAEEIAPVLEPLRLGFDQAPAIAELIELWADAWTRTTARPSEADVQRLVRGAEQFIAEPRVGLRVARALGRHGKTAEARAVLGAAFLHVRDDAMRAQLAQMFAALKTDPKK
ncbi:MAG: hypothetical protein Q8N18_00245 [Opitutaceae bacterium]|nr:hypothetical protein [Opitutaceae bacterium]